MAQVNLDWTQIKAVADGRKLAFQWFQFETQYFIVIIDGALEGICWLNISTPPSADQTDFETNYKAKGNNRQDTRIFNDRGGMIVDSDYRRGPAGSYAITLNTHCFGDRTTWFQNSARVVGETLTDSGDGLTFNAANPHWINVNSNRLSYTYKKWPTRTGAFAAQTTWNVNVYVGGVKQTSGYVVDYTNGKVTFTSSQTGNTVTCDYSHNNNTQNPSEFIILAPTNTKYVLETIELQFSQNISFNDQVLFEVWAGPPGSTINTFYNASLGGWFPIYLYEAGYGQQRMIYRNIRDFLNMSNNTGSVALPACGGLNQPILIFPFTYVKAVVLDSKNAALIRLKLVNDTQIADCELATCTFYMDVDPD